MYLKGSNTSTTPYRSLNRKASNPGGQVRVHTLWEIPERQAAEAERQTMASALLVPTVGDTLS